MVAIGAEGCGTCGFREGAESPKVVAKGSPKAPKVGPAMIKEPFIHVPALDVRQRV